MSRKFNLKRMLAEVAEDTKIQRQRRDQLSQREIRQLFSDRRKKEHADRGSGD